MSAPGGKHGYGGYSGPVNFGHGEERDGYATKVIMILKNLEFLWLTLSGLGT